MNSTSVSEAALAAVSVNHNTSAYTELLLRSFFAMHGPQLNCSFTLYDNHSSDEGLSSLRDYADAKEIPIIQSGYETQTMYNSHGEILRRFVLENPACTHYLFLDTDVCFIEPNTIDTMLAELAQDDTFFGIGPRMSFDGVNEISEEALKGNPDVQSARLHPCCALVKNTAIFRQVVKEVGLSAVNYHWADHKEYVDTFKLMTRVMHTHGLSHCISSKMVIHFVAVSYESSPNVIKVWKARQRDERLASLRR